VCGRRLIRSLKQQLNQLVRYVLFGKSPDAMTGVNGF